jgi:hypothetical protein
MVIVGRVILKDPNGSGRVEVTVSHNAQPGSRFEASRAYEHVRSTLVKLGEGTGIDLTIETEGWAG